MIAVILAPFYIIFQIGILHWFLRWLGNVNSMFQKKRVKMPLAVIFLVIVLSPGIGFLIGTGKVARILKLIGNYCFGVTIYAYLIGLIARIVWLVLKHCKGLDQEKLRSRKASVISGAICLGLLLIISVYGMINARTIRTTKYEIKVDKKVESMDSLNVVLIADLHMGYNIGCAHIQQMVDKINAQKPDVVVIAGDIFDNEYEALEDPDKLVEILRGIDSKYGVYAAYGNHDIKEKILAGFTFKSSKKKMSDPRMDTFLEKADVRLLRDEYVMLSDEVYLYGRPDEERPGRGIDVRKTADEITQDMDLSKPIIVIDHEPKELAEVARAKVDVDLSGHTHDGQMFPGTILTDLMWENPTGYLKKEEMHSIVTSGVGVFAPFMRVGTKAEICTIKIDFN